MIIGDNILGSHARAIFYRLKQLVEPLRYGADDPFTYEERWFFEDIACLLNAIEEYIEEKESDDQGAETLNDEAKKTIDALNAKLQAYNHRLQDVDEARENAENTSIAFQGVIQDIKKMVGIADDVSPLDVPDVLEEALKKRLPKAKKPDDTFILLEKLIDALGLDETATHEELLKAVKDLIKEEHEHNEDAGKLLKRLRAAEAKIAQQEQMLALIQRALANDIQ